MDDSVSSVILLIGMAVGIDYSLFYVKREREERKRGLSEEAALEAAAATSGRAVLISGVTVLIAMAGMFLMGDNSFFGFAIATMLVVAIAMIGSVTVLPALLSKFGDKINKGRMPWVKRREKREQQGIGTPEGGRMWNAILDRVLKRPLVSAVAATAVLVALSIPALGLHLADSGTDGLPQDLAVVKTYNKIQKAFPGKELPATVVVKAKDVNSPQVKGAISASSSAPTQARASATASTSPSTPITRSPRSTCRCSATAPTRAPRPPSMSCARTSSRPRSGSCRAPRSARPATPPARSTCHRAEEQGAAGAGLRARPGVPAPARHVPLDRDPAQGDRAEPAVSQRRLRRARARLPERLRRGPPRLQLHGPGIDPAWSSRYSSS